MSNEGGSGKYETYLDYFLWFSESATRLLDVILTACKTKRWLNKQTVLHDWYLGIGIPTPTPWLTLFLVLGKTCVKLSKLTAIS